MTMKVKAIEKKLKFTKDPNDPGVYRYVMQPEQYSSLTQKKVIKEAALRSGVSQGVGDQGVGNGRPLGGTAWTGHHALRTALEVGREGGRREVEPDYHPPHHLHARRGPEGRAEEHRCADYLLRPRRQGGEARDQR